jgi:D-serine deaminase-like pyridoxal phosphate-dependent protein
MKIKKPTLIIDKQIVLKNIERMAVKAKKANIRLRPHFKTHQSAQIGGWFRRFGIEAITVSSVEMALYFADNGWQDITIAFPANVLEIDEINGLCRRIDLNLLVESPETVSFLAKRMKHHASVWIKIDTGYNRTGINSGNVAEAAAIAREIERSPALSFKGILCHAGHSYKAKSVKDLKRIFDDTVNKMNTLRQQLPAEEFSNIEISVGDTPTCSIAEDFTGIDEIRCGNFVYYDVQQLMLGACRQEDIAVFAACPVVAKHPERNELVIYGGAVHLSVDYVKSPQGKKIYGLASTFKDHTRGAIEEDTYVSSLSQEHGIIKTHSRFFDRVKIGDILTIWPAHSCLTANLLQKSLLVI